MREPIYAFDELKRSFYLNCAIQQELPAILRDLFGKEAVGEEIAKLWRQQAEAAFLQFDNDYCEPLRKNRGKELETVEAVSQAAEHIGQELLKYVPEPIQSRLEEMAQGDYCFYRSCGFGKYWNEVPLPEVVEILFERFCQLVGENKSGKFAVAVYDMSDKEIIFSTEKQIDELRERYDLEPCEKMFLENGVWHCG